MAFRIGSPFSPEILQLLAQKQEAAKNRGLQAARLAGSKRTVTQTTNGNSDAYLRAQLAAEQADKDRELKLKLAQMGQEESAADRKSREGIARGSAMDQQTRFNQDLAQKQAVLEADKEYKKGMLANKNELAAAKQEGNIYKQIVELGGVIRKDEKGNLFVAGPDGKPIKTTSKSEVRGAQKGKTEADTEYVRERTNLTKEQINKIKAEVDGTLPEIKDKKRRTDLIERGLNIRLHALTMRSTSDARKLAADVIEMFKDPAFGGFGKPENFQAAQDQANAVFGYIMNQRGQDAAKAFADAYQKVASEAVQGEVAKAQAARSEELRKQAKKDNKSKGDSELDAFMGSAVGGVPGK